MSLINEALKRAQRELNKRPFETPTPNQPKYQAPPTPKRQKKNTTPFLLVCALLFGATAAMLAVLVIEKPSTLSPKPKQRKIVALKEQPKKDSVVLTQQEPINTPEEIVFNNLLTEPKETPSIEEKGNLIIETALNDLNQPKIKKIVTNTPFLQEEPIIEEKTSIEQEYIETKQKLDQLSRIAKNTDRVEPKVLPHTFTPPAKDPINEFLDTLTINGIMYSGENSKVLLNNRVFTKNSVVHTRPMLTLSEIRPHELVFRSASGDIFRKEL